MEVPMMEICLRHPVQAALVPFFNSLLPGESALKLPGELVVPFVDLPPAGCCCRSVLRLSICFCATSRGVLPKVSAVAIFMSAPATLRVVKASST